MHGAEVIPAAGMLTDGSLRIVALKGNEPVGAWEFDKACVTIGRSKTADVRLDDAAVSRIHCIIEVRDSGVYARDNGSRNGIWVNGRRVEEALLSSRDEVVIERFRLKSYRVWGGNTGTAKFVDKVEDKTRVGTGKNGAGKRAPSAPAPAVAKPSMMETERGPKAPAPVAKAAIKSDVSEELEQILDGVRPVRRAEPKAPVAEPVKVASKKSPAPKPSSRRPAVQEDSLWMFEEPDDEDEEDTIVPLFDLAGDLAAAKTRATEGRGVIEVVRYRGFNVLDVARIDRGGAYELPFTNVPLVHFNGGNAATIEVLDGMSAEHRRGGSAKRVSGSVTLRYGELVDLVNDDGTGYLVRFADPREPKRNAKLDFDPEVVMGQMVASIGTHAVVAGLCALVVMLRPAQVVYSDFAKVQMPDEIAKADPTPVPTPEPKAKPTPPVKQPKTPPTKLAKRPEPRNNQPVGGADKTEAKVASAGVLGGLGKLNIKIDSPNPMLAAVTNLDAVRSTSGKSGGFKVSALTGRVPGDVALGRAGRANGDVDINTLSGKDLLANGVKGGYGGLAKTGGGKVRGVVTQTPTQNVGVQGSLDRAQIAAVVNKHIAEIRHCYEKNLINDPSLNGKIQVEWTINPDGTVAGVKTLFSSMKGGDVNGCIGGRIREWQFPRPKGNGYVIVNYPFMFDSVGF